MALDRIDVTVAGDIPDRPLLVDDLPLEVGLRGTLAQLADRIANIIHSAPLTCPILVTGDWGSGKTSLLHGVCKRLDDNTLEKGSNPTVIFEAWQYESANALLAALMRRIWEATPDAYKAKKAAKALLWELVHWAASIATRMAGPVFGSALGLPPGLESELDLGKATKRAAKLLGDTRPPPDPVDALRDAFAKLVTSAWGDRAPVVFIDDLDRCNPADAVMLLDGIRSLATCAERLRVRFVVAIDRSVVTQAISAKFANVRGYDGNRYLEKIFPLEFQVPNPLKSEIVAIIEALAAPLDPAERKLTVFALTEALDKPYFANARLIKRCFNRYRLLRYFEQHTPSGGDTDRRSLQWIAATERWPRLRTLHQRRQPNFWTTVAPRQPIEDPDLKLLMAEPGFQQWLAAHNWPNHAGVLDDYDQPDERLRHFGM